MEESRLKELLQAVKDGSLEIEACVKQLQTLPYQEMEWACLDHHRRFRDILPEVVYGPGKSVKQLIAIVESLASRGGPLLVTRIKAEKAEQVMNGLDGSSLSGALEYSEEARALYIENPQYLEAASRRRGYVAVVTAGTADVPVAEEACLTLRLAGHKVKRVYDSGVAGVHRLISRIEVLSKSTAIIAIAGMDGALPSVIGGLVAVPVIAVPTSTGYGANFDGIAPLLTMLNSCATGVSVVNIDNGFGAAAVAAMINTPRD